MKITFDNMTQVNQNSEKIHRSVQTGKTTKTYSYNVAFDGKDRIGFGTENTVKGKNTSVPSVGDSVEAQVQNMRDQLTVMSHTMSDEDFAKMQEEGYDPSEMDPQEAVTILDKIKAELLKAGEHIAGYTDNMNMTTLTAALGNEALAVALTESFSQKDIPLERQNVEQVVWALNIAEGLEVPTESTYYYMASNDMSATLKDFYMASASGSKLELKQSSQYFGEAVKGYVTKNVTPAHTEVTMDMEQEIEKLLERLGIPAQEEEKAVVAWLVSMELPVDAASVHRMKDVLAVSFPLKPEQIIQTAAAAIADGIPVGEKNLTDNTTYIEKATVVYEMYQGEDALSLIQDRRQLEEIRLRMTVETNVKLLQSGFSIDTAPIEETIEALKQAQQELAKEYFPQAENPEIKYQQYKEATQLLKELPGLPAAAVGRLAERLQTTVFAQFHAEGVQLAAAYKAAGERYETVWTAPRADLGDSIQKAFANVEEILRDLNYEATEENRKAVRILGYNRMAVNEENIERVKAAQSQVEQVIRQMTPAATLKMIRDGVNPLEATLPRLQQYFEELPMEYAESAEKYSKFLYQLEKSDQITQQEREAFIGCYRLLHQIEKSDGAVVGALVNTGAELNFQNLLSAVRTGRHKGLDVRISDAIGALSEEAVMKLSISEQIEQGYVKEEAQAHRKQLQEAANGPKESFQLLERGELPASSQNLLAAKVLEQESHLLFAKQLERQGKKQERPEGWKKLDNKTDFAEEYKASLEEAIEQVTIDTLQVDTGVDVRSMKLVHKQLTIMQNLSTNEEYFIPMEIGGELTGVHLQFTHNKEEMAMVRIRITGSYLGNLSGTLQVTQNGVEGYFVGNQEEMVMNLKKSSDIFNNLREEWKSCEVEFVYSESDYIPMDWTRTSTKAKVSTDSLYSLSKNFLQALKAVGDGIEER